MCAICVEPLSCPPLTLTTTTKFESRPGSFSAMMVLFPLPPSSLPLSCPCVSFLTSVRLQRRCVPSVSRQTNAAITSLLNGGARRCKKITLNKGSESYLNSFAKRVSLASSPRPAVAVKQQPSEVHAGSGQCWRAVQRRGLTFESSSNKKPALETATVSTSDQRQKECPTPRRGLLC